MFAIGHDTKPHLGDKVAGVVLLPVATAGSVLETHSVAKFVGDDLGPELHGFFRRF